MKAGSIHQRVTARTWAIIFAGLMVISWILFAMSIQNYNFVRKVVDEQSGIINQLSQALQDRNSKTIGPVY